MTENCHHWSWVNDWEHIKICTARQLYPPINKKDQASNSTATPVPLPQLAHYSYMQQHSTLQSQLWAVEPRGVIYDVILSVVSFPSCTAADIYRTHDKLQQAGKPASNMHYGQQCRSLCTSCTLVLVNPLILHADTTKPYTLTAQNNVTTD
jgi:hypothetical protein